MGAIAASLLKATEEAMTRVMAMTHPADAVLSRYFREHPVLGARDRAFIAETVFGALRRYRLLEAGGARSPRELVLGFLARCAGRNLKELEPLSPQQRAVVSALKALREDTLPPAVQAEFPDWLAERVGAAYGEAEMLAIGRGMQTPAPLDLRVNTLKMTRDAVLEQLRADGIAGEPTARSPVGIRLEDKPAINQHPLFLEGAIEVQDEGSQLLGYLLAPRRGDMVVDFCAGAGGKTLHLGALMRSLGRLYAFDVSARRIAQLKPRLARSGLSNVHPQRIDSENDARVKRLVAKVDRVLVDAPCSGTGTLRRNPDLKWRQSPRSVSELTAKQAAILASAERLVKPGGRLVYATCSLLPEENDGIVEDFLARHPEFAVLPAEAVLRSQDIVVDTSPFLRLFPHRHVTDGFFAAVLERVKG
jgi:16S rRNA (cytosine967-C5)-methyltransferase